jgi:hypothetical protein
MSNPETDVELSSKQVRNQGYQNLSWSGRGWPADIKSREMEL